MENHSDVCMHIAVMIRARSQAGQLIEGEEIRAELSECGPVEPGDCDREILSETTFKQVLEEHPDLRAIAGPNGKTYYHSVESLSESYAGILVWKSENPLHLVAHVVRENSRLYPRPVPLESFQGPPFDLAREEIAECLATMAQQEEYRDIAETFTSIGTRFLYSTCHLERDHASMLAEWLDLGQGSNP